MRFTRDMRISGMILSGKDCTGVLANNMFSAGELSAMAYFCCTIICEWTQSEDVMLYDPAVAKYLG